MQQDTIYPSYLVFKGLQRPLEFLGFRGRYVWWACLTAGGGLFSLLVFSTLFNITVATVVMLVIFSVGAYFLFTRIPKGLHSKKEYKGIYIFSHSVSLF